MARAILGISETQYKKFVKKEWDNWERSKVWEPFRTIKDSMKYRIRIARFRVAPESKKYLVYLYARKHQLLDATMLSPFEFQPQTIQQLKLEQSIQLGTSDLDKDWNLNQYPRKPASSKRNRSKDSNGGRDRKNLKSETTSFLSTTESKFPVNQIQEPKRAIILHQEPLFFSPNGLSLNVWDLGIVEEETRGQMHCYNEVMCGQSRGAIPALTKAYKYEYGMSPMHIENAKKGKRPPSPDVITISDFYPEAGTSLPDSGDIAAEILNPNQWISSETILRAMKLIRKEIKDLPGLLPTELVKTLNYCCKSDDTILQILHCDNPGHWCFMAATTLEAVQTVSIFDSFYTAPRPGVIEQIASLLRCKQSHFKVKMAWCPKQSNPNDCGLNAIANLTQYSIHPNRYQFRDWTWNEGQLRHHLLKCLIQEKMTEFPKVPQENHYRRQQSEDFFTFSVHCICRQTCQPDCWYGGPRVEADWVRCSMCSTYFHPP